MKEKARFSPAARNNRDEAEAFTDTPAFSLLFSLSLLLFETAREYYRIRRKKCRAISFFDKESTDPPKDCLKNYWENTNVFR